MKYAESPSLIAACPSWLNGALAHFHTHQSRSANVLVWKVSFRKSCAKYCASVFCRLYSCIYDIFWVPKIAQFKPWKHHHVALSPTEYCIFAYKCIFLTCEFEEKNFVKKKNRIFLFLYFVSIQTKNWTCFLFTHVFSLKSRVVSSVFLRFQV